MKRFTLLLVVQIIINIEQISVLCTTTTTRTTDAHLNSNNNSNASNTTLIKSSRINATRTIQRLMGGHIQHNTENQYSQRNKNAKIYFRRKITIPTQPQYQHEQQKVYPVYQRPKFDERDPYDDALLLNDNKIDNYDFELIKSSAGAGKEPIVPKKNETKKTLADQVAEGKYGLIEKELFQKQPKRPGIISYTANKEVPSDTSKNFGGLESDDIWLAEDHLLVLKGGGLNKKDREEPWSPIDDYQAPLRQVKIPDNPKVPPPFPVQLEENGPIKFIGDNQFPFFNPFANESLYFGEANKGGPNGPYSPNLPSGFGASQNFTGNNGYQYPPPIPPWLLNNNETFVNPFVNGPPFPGGPFPGPFPPFPFNDTGNGTEPIDEDDPRLYYPPPYSFVYKSNYSNPVEPGPLVPGIVLPPPPNFFSRLNKSPKLPSPPVTKLIKQQLRPITSTTTTTHRPVTTTATTLKQVIPNNNDKYVITNYVKPIRKRPQPPTTTLTPVVDTTTSRPYTTLNKVVSVTPNVIQFVPKISSENNVYNKGNPIYYEYFDARKPNQFVTPITNSPIDEHPHQIKSTSPKTIYKETITQVYQNERPNYHRPQHTYLPVKQFDYDKYYYVTPKPEITSNGESDNFVPENVDKSISFKPLPSFDQEIETIRQTLQYYKNSAPKVGGSTNGYTQSLQQTPPPRTAKAKVVYDYSYEPIEVTTRKPYSNIEFDTTPFKPIIQYSSPYETSDGFKAIQYSSTEDPNNYYTQSTPVTYNNPKFVPREPSLKITPVRLPQRYLPPQSYRTSTENPTIYYTTQKESQNNNYDDITQKYFNSFGQRINGNHEVTESIPSTTLRTTRPWVTIEKHIVKELPQLGEIESRPPRPTSQQNGNGASFGRLQEYVDYNSYNNKNNNQNNNNNENTRSNYYQSNNNNNNNNYNQDDQFNKQVTVLRNRIRNYPSNPSQNQYQISLVNDTYVNYRNPRPPINPDSEYIQPQYNTQQPQQILNYYPNSNRPQSQQIPSNNNNNNNQPPPSLHQDTIVNYKYPLPPINPDSEYIIPQNYRKYNSQQNPVIQYRLPGDQAHVYFITPRELKYRKK